MVESGGYRFTVKVGKPKDPDRTKSGTKLARGANFRCVMSGVPMSQDHIRREFRSKRNGERLLAVVAEGDRGRVYLAPTPDHEAIARSAKPKWRPEQEMNQDSSNLVSGRGYGITHWHEIFTPRQLVALTTFSDLATEALERVKYDALAAGLPNADKRLCFGGTGATAYADALAVYLGLSVSRQANRTATLNFWDTKGENVQQVFARQALPMTWDFVEGNPLSSSTGNFNGQVNYLSRVIGSTVPATPNGIVEQSDAQTQVITKNKIVSTDPPYYDNIGYADLSDFFYIWLRPSLKPIFPDLFATLTVPKAEELVATPYRHGSKEAAEVFFMDGMTKAMQRLMELSNPAFPVTIYYAFRQAETESETTVSTGWETFLDAVIQAGFAISGTWPMRTEDTGNLKKNVSALASSIILVCRQRAADLNPGTHRDFLTSLKQELPVAIAHLQRGNIAPVDLAQSAIGPGMAVFTKYSKVINAEGKPLSVRDALGSNKPDS